MLVSLYRAGLVAAWVVLAAIIAIVVGPVLWAGEGGRDLRPPGVVLASILLVSAAAFRLKLRWSWVSLLGGLGIIEGAALLIIAYFSGGDVFSQFNLRWLMSLNAYIGLPWIVGLFVGSGLLSLKDPAGDGNQRVQGKQFTAERK